MTDADPALIDDLVAANRILYDQGVVDGFGHVSGRHDQNPERFLLARSMAPGLVTAADIMEFDLAGDPIDPQGRTPYLERFIHSEIYKAYPAVQAVVHSHSPAVIPFGVVGTPLKPIYHMGSFLGLGVPVFEIREAGGPATDRLIRSPPTAGFRSCSGSSETGQHSRPLRGKNDRPVALTDRGLKMT